MSSADQPAFRALAQFAAISLLGLVAAPALLDPSLSPLAGLLSGPLVKVAPWLAFALLLVVWLIAIAPTLARSLAGIVLRRLPAQPSRSREAILRLDASRFARWSIIAICFLVAQASLRRPLSLVLDTQFAISSSNAIVSACSLALLLLIIWRLHAVARPLIEASARNLLDTLLATTGTGAPGELTLSASAAPTGEETTTSATGPGSSGAVVVSARGPATSTRDETVHDQPSGRAPPESDTGDETAFDTTETPALASHVQAAPVEARVASAPVTAAIALDTPTSEDVDTLDPDEGSDATIQADAPAPRVDHDDADSTQPAA